MPECQWPLNLTNSRKFAYIARILAIPCILPPCLSRLSAHSTAIIASTLLSFCQLCRYRSIVTASSLCSDLAIISTFARIPSIRYRHAIPARIRSNSLLLVECLALSWSWFDISARCLIPPALTIRFERNDNGVRMPCLAIGPDAHISLLWTDLDISWTDRLTHISVGWR